MFRIGLECTIEFPDTTGLPDSSIYFKLYASNKGRNYLRNLGGRLMAPIGGVES